MALNPVEQALQDWGYFLGWNPNGDFNPLQAGTPISNAAAGLGITAQQGQQDINKGAGGTITAAGPSGALPSTSPPQTSGGPKPQYSSGGNRSDPGSKSSGGGGGNSGWAIDVNGDKIPDITTSDGKYSQSSMQSWYNDLVAAGIDPKIAANEIQYVIDGQLPIEHLQDTLERYRTQTTRMGELQNTQDTVYQRVRDENADLQRLLADPNQIRSDAFYGSGIADAENAMASYAETAKRNAQALAATRGGSGFSGKTAAVGQAADIARAQEVGRVSDAARQDARGRQRYNEDFLRGADERFGAARDSIRGGFEPNWSSLWDTRTGINLGQRGLSQENFGNLLQILSGIGGGLQNTAQMGISAASPFIGKAFGG